MRKVKFLSVVIFAGLLGLGVASCFNPNGPGNGGHTGGGGGVGDTNIHHGGGGGGRDTTGTGGGGGKGDSTNTGGGKGDTLIIIDTFMTHYHTSGAH